MESRVSLVIIGDCEHASLRPNRPDGLPITHSSRFLVPQKESASDFIHQNESLEYLVREQPPARRQADEVSPLLHQLGFDKLRNRGASILDRFLAEFPGEFLHANPPCQP